MTRSLPIVGDRHYTCATALIHSLPHNHPLRLIPEPTNLHDPNAKRVIVLRDSIPPATWGALSPRDAFTLREMESNLVQIGHIKATVAATVTEAECEPDARLVFQSNRPFAITGEP
jgi:hypothetical protein